MARFTRIETAAGQASLLFLGAGVLGLVSELVPSVGSSTRLIYLATLVLGILVPLVPWERWGSGATIALVPVALALIAAGRWFAPDYSSSLYALWFAVVFGWVGSWHPARTSLWLAPVAAVAYVIPFLPGAPAASSDSLASVVIAIPVSVMLAEVLAAKTHAMERARSGLEEAATLLERANVTDDLTGLGNRRRANTLIDGIQPGDTLVLLDLDHFKAVNDAQGHAAGDQVLIELGSYLRGAVRDADCVARFGGEEFLILLRNAGDDASAIIERLLAGWRRSGCGVTLSAGAALHVAGCGPAATLKRADALLYQAKAEGRDRLATETRIAVADLTA